MIAWLASYPRSGNSYCRFVAYTCCGVRSLDRYAIGVPDARPYVHNVAGPQEALAANETERYFIKTHDLPVEGDVWPTIYLVRDGRDALVSYAWFHLLHDQQRSRDSVTAEEYRATVAALLREEQSPFGTWSRHVDAWQDRATRAETVMLRFEDFIEQPDRIATAIEQLGLGTLQPGVRAPSYADLQAMSPRACRRGVIGSWRDEFPCDLLADFWSRHGDTMRRWGYE